MKTVLIFIALACVAVNIADNSRNNTAQGMQEARSARAERLCNVNPVYCYR